MGDFQDKLQFYVWIAALMGVGWPRLGWVFLAVMGVVLVILRPVK